MSENTKNATKTEFEILNVNSRAKKWNKKIVTIYFCWKWSLFKSLQLQFVSAITISFPLIGFPQRTNSTLKWNGKKRIKKNVREDSTCRQVLSKTHNITSPSEPPLTERNLVGELLPTYSPRMRRIILHYSKRLEEKILKTLVCWINQSTELSSGNKQWVDSHFRTF